ncbi:MAG: UDP-N-acetylmuramoyl-L-alanine--D-glutamate ligase [Patescibacteria group bacterium]
MNPLDQYIKDKTVTVMGLGLHGGGLSVTQWLLQHAKHVVVTDLKTSDQLKPSIEKLEVVAEQLGAASKLIYVFGEHREEDFENTDLVIKNPDVPVDSPYILHAKAHDVPVYNEASLFFLLCEKPIIGITGSKGKSTTTSMLGDMIHTTYPTVPVAGNIKITPMFEIIDVVNEDPTIPFVVLELSSWQLEDMDAIHRSPHVGVLTNIFPEHLNRHKTMENYIAAKSVIEKYQSTDDVFVYNADNEYAATLADTNKAQKLAFSTRKSVEKGVYWLDDELREVLDGEEKTILHAEDIPLVGEHNRANAAAAALVARLFDVTKEQIVKAIRSYKALPARMQCVGEFQKRIWYNDTTATAPDAAQFALEAFDEKSFLIAGGFDKKLPVDDFADTIVKKALFVALLPGEGSAMLEKALHDRAYAAYAHTPTMDEAVALALEKTPEKGVVLLSPGFSSFASFTHEFERGDFFEKAVRAL